MGERKRARRGATGTTERRSGTRDSKVGGFGRIKRNGDGGGGETQTHAGGERRTERVAEGKTGSEGERRNESRNPEVIKELLSAT